MVMVNDKNNIINEENDTYDNTLYIKYSLLGIFLLLLIILVFSKYKKNNIMKGSARYGRDDSLIYKKFFGY